MNRFLRAKRVRLAWIHARARAEWQRQRAILLSLLHAFSSWPSDTSAAFELANALQAFDARLKPATNAATIGRLAQQAWQDERAELERVLIAQPLSGVAIELYLRERVIRALHWFDISGRRIRSGERRRARWLAAIFTVSLVVSCLRVVLGTHVGHQVLSTLSFLSLVITAIAGATAAFHSGQNQRSLMHWYEVQVTAAKSWLENFLHSYAGSSHLGSNPEHVVGAIKEILRFEDSMIDEFVNWALVTEHDSIELSA